ncbi:MAG: 3-phosphoshikimate 1-carboxyvinyltransferase [Lachnospiraceae bacterium]|nr:3-phosphoshikimate 1-carboxyvinyltransferase [Lachnospiraceae bacterium]
MENNTHIFTFNDDDSEVRVRKFTGAGSSFCRRFKVPGSKSITNRALLLAVLSDREVTLHGAALSDDSEAFIDCLKSLGISVTEHDPEDPQLIRVNGCRGDLPSVSSPVSSKGSVSTVNVCSAGTAARFITALLGIQRGTYRIEASEQMQKRPMKELFDVLVSLGTRIRYEGTKDFLPAVISGDVVAENLNSPDFYQGLSIKLNIDRSSQFLSALLMVLPVISHDFCIELTGKREAQSYVTMTRQMMERFGFTGTITRTGRYGEPDENGNVYHVKYDTEYPYELKSDDYYIEPDVSAACYFYAMAAANNIKAGIANMKKDSLQGDMCFIKLLGSMGCRLEWEDTLYVTGPGKLSGLDIDMSDFSDQALTLAAIAPFCSGPVNIRGIGHIRKQECDRIHAIIENLNGLGIKAAEGPDSVRVYPGSPKCGIINTFGDHRVSMSFALTAMTAGGIVIKDPLCCRKTFPDFYRVASGFSDYEAK